MSFKIIEGDGAGKEERERQRDREWAEREFSWAIRECAANMLRIVRGAGKPHEILLQMKKAIDTAVKFQEVHGYFPSSDFIQSELKLYDEHERQSDREREGQLGQETIDRWREDGFFERMLAKHTICRGALQIAASGLIGQDTQQRNGEHEFHEGLHQLERLREERIRKEREALRATRPAPVKRKPRKARKSV
jgi:hypothetical protein